jgi:hypothetical protein
MGFLGNTFILVSLTFSLGLFHGETNILFYKYYQDDDDYFILDQHDDLFD